MQILLTYPAYIYSLNIAQSYIDSINKHRSLVDSQIKEQRANESLIRVAQIVILN